MGIVSEFDSDGMERIRAIQRSQRRAKIDKFVERTFFIAILLATAAGAAIGIYLY